MHVCKEKVESDVKELEIPSFSEVGEETSRYAALTGVSHALLVSTTTRIPSPLAHRWLGLESHALLVSTTIPLKPH